MGTTKTCVICQQDVSNRKRVKDAHGRYYCHPCYHATSQAAGVPSNVPADTYGVAEPDFSQLWETAGGDDPLASAAAAATAPARRAGTVRRSPSKASGGADGKLLIKILAVCGVLVALGVVIALASQGGSSGGRTREDAEGHFPQPRQANTQDPVEESNRLATAQQAEKEVDRLAEAEVKRRADESAAVQAMETQRLEAKEREARAQGERERQEESREPAETFDAGEGFAYGDVQIRESILLQRRGLECSLKLVNRTGRDVSSLVFRVDLYDQSGESLQTSGKQAVFQIHPGQTQTCRLSLLGPIWKVSDFASYKVTIYPSDVTFRRKLEQWRDDK